MGDTPDERWFVRVQQAYVDRAGRGVFRYLADRPARFSRPPTSVSLVTLAAAIHLLSLGAVGWLIWRTLTAGTVMQWIIALGGWVVVWNLAPRPPRVPADAVTLDGDDSRALRALVEAMADTMGARPPAVLGVDHSFNAYVMATGWRMHTALVIGLPLWTVLAPAERLALLGHELSHHRHQDTWIGWVVGSARRTVGAIVQAFWPPTYEIYREPNLLERVARRGQQLLALPAIGALLAMSRAEARASQFAEYTADRRAASVVGPKAVIGLLSHDLPGYSVVAGSAARRDEDPFGVLDVIAAGSDSDVAGGPSAASLDTARWDDTHPLTADRLSLLRQSPPANLPSIGVPDRLLVLVDRATQDLARLRPRVLRALEDSLLDT